MKQSLTDDLKLILRHLDAAMDKADSLALGMRQQLSGLMVQASDCIGTARDFIESAISKEAADGG